MRVGNWRQVAIGCLLLWLAQPRESLHAASAGSTDAFPPLFPQPDLFTHALDNSRAQPLGQRITGVTLPHHLLAVDLIADVFRQLATQHYERIIILSPDHFSRSASPAATTRRPFQTALGTVPIDQEAIAALLSNPLVSTSDLFSQEHGIHALLPFVARCFPGVPVIPVALQINSQPSQWDELQVTIAPLLTERTLIIQSTDFSHYLDSVEARKRDQQTLRALSSGDPALIAALRQPANLDSRAAQYLQLKLQKEIFHARPNIAANRNSQHYSATPLSKTTSYIVQLYSPEPIPLAGHQRYFFAGDTFFGRYMLSRLQDSAYRLRLIDDVRRITGGAKLIVNLEGVVLPRCPARPRWPQLAMPAGTTVSMLKALNVIAVSLANNHSHDFGPVAYRNMKRQLVRAGITPLDSGQVTEFGNFCLATATDIDNQGSPRTNRLQEAAMAAWKPDESRRPLFAFLHFGEEYRPEPSPRQRALASQVEAHGVELVIGSHPHVAGELDCGLESCRAWSLGNFIFDQHDPRVSGSVLEITFFEENTYFLQLHPIGNLYTER